MKKWIEHPMAQALLWLAAIYAALVLICMGFIHTVEFFRKKKKLKSSKWVFEVSNDASKPNSAIPRDNQEEPIKEKPAKKEVIPTQETSKAIIPQPEPIGEWTAPKVKKTRKKKTAKQKKINFRKATSSSLVKKNIDKLKTNLSSDPSKDDLE